MSGTLRDGFCVGPWQVEPLRGAVSGRDSDERHLEPKVMDVLVCLAEHAGTLVTRDELLDSVWGAATVSDETLTRAIGELRRALEDDSHHPAFIETVPKRGYRLIAAVSMPTGHDVIAGSSAPSSPGKTRYGTYGIAAGCFVIVAFIVALGMQDPAEPLPGGRLAPGSSIAVLPFRNLAADDDDTYLVDGIHNEIITQLAKLTLLDKVISRTSVERYRDTTRSIGEIGRELGVATVMEGSVQRDGDAVRISVQLIDAESEEHLWAEVYERDLTAAGLFTIQSDITTSIADELRVILTPAEREQLASLPTGNMAAYDEYLRGKKAMATRRVDSLLTARNHFENAIMLDPVFSLAYESLAETITLLVIYGGLPEDAYERAESVARRALRIDDGLGEAHAALGLIGWRRSRARLEDFSGVAKDFERAQQLAPGYVPAYQWYAMALQDMERFDTAEHMMRRALSLAPLDPNLHTDMGTIYSSWGRHDEALDSFERALEIEPAWAPAKVELGYHHMAAGDLVSAVTWYRRALSDDPSEVRATAQLVACHLALEMPVEADYWYRRLQNRPKTFWQRSVALRYERERGGDRQAVAAALRYRAEAPNCRFCVDVRARVLTENGQATQALALYAERYPGMLDDPEAGISIANIRSVAPYAQALIASGRSEDARRLLVAGLKLAAGMPRQRHGNVGLGIEDVNMHLLLGERDEAMYTLRQAVESGWRPWLPRFETEMLDQLADEAEFQGIMGRLEAANERDRMRLRMLEDNGELPPIPASDLGTEPATEASDLW